MSTFRKPQSVFTPETLSKFDVVFDEVWHELLADGTFQPLDTSQTRTRLAQYLPPMAGLKFRSNSSSCEHFAMRLRVNSEQDDRNSLLMPVPQEPPPQVQFPRTRVHEVPLDSRTDEELRGLLRNSNLSERRKSFFQEILRRREEAKAAGRSRIYLWLAAVISVFSVGIASLIQRT